MATRYPLVSEMRHFAILPLFGLALLAGCAGPAGEPSAVAPPVAHAAAPAQVPLRAALEGFQARLGAAPAQRRAAILAGARRPRIVVARRDVAGHAPKKAQRAKKEKPAGGRARKGHRREGEAAGLSRSNSGDRGSRRERRRTEWWSALGQRVPPINCMSPAASPASGSRRAHILCSLLHWFPTARRVR